MIADVERFACQGLWSGLARIALCERESTSLITGKVTVGRRFFLNSLPADAALIARSVRQHWQVENRPHWQLDMVFREDARRARDRYAATNLSSCARMALNLLMLAQPKVISIVRLRRRAACSPDYLAAIIAPWPVECQSNQVSA